MGECECVCVFMQGLYVCVSMCTVYVRGCVCVSCPYDVFYMIHIISIQQNKHSTPWLSISTLELQCINENMELDSLGFICHKPKKTILSTFLSEGGVTSVYVYI